MSCRFRARENARPWNNPGALSLDPEDDDLDEGEQPEGEAIGDWSSIGSGAQALSQITTSPASIADGGV